MMNDEDKRGHPSLVIITGMSGAGRTEAMHTFEDMGYFCIDNLPPSLIENLVALADLHSQIADSTIAQKTTAESRVSVRKLAVVCDLRSHEFFSQLNAELKRITVSGIAYSLVFLDANDAILLARFKATRRKHPLCEGTMTISDGIAKERAALAAVRENANFIINTSEMDSRELRREIREFYSQGPSGQTLNVSVFSFGFKHRTPTDADIVIDVRFLPNPFYEPELSKQTGLDLAVCDFVLSKTETQEFLRSWRDLLSVVMPGYVSEGKRYLSIGIGCTGGQHRSVALAVQTGEFLKSLGYSTLVTHRDLSLASTAQAEVHA